MAVEVEEAVAERDHRRYPTQRRAPTEYRDEEEREEEQVDIGSFRDVAVDFVAGLVSGSAGIIVGQVVLSIQVYQLVS